MIYSSYIELDRKALQKNIRYLKKRIGDAKFCSVIKGDAYGHGIRHFLPVAEDCGVDYFAVGDAREAKWALKAKKPDTQIMIMAMIDNDQLEWAVENDISFFVFEMDRLNHAIGAANKVGKPARIHIEVETGMNRTGFEKDELGKVRLAVLNHPQELFVEGLCTHYAGAESVANYLRIMDQFNTFEKRVKWFAKQGIVPRYKHTACSAAALTYPRTIMDMVRFGIACYGFWPSKETRMYNLLSDDTKFTVDPLRRVLSWKSRVMSVKPVSKGKFIGYGTSHMAYKDLKVAVIPVGYSQGYSRGLSNLGHVLIRNRKAPVMGMVTMNMFTVDVTHIPDVAKGDEVVLIGKQGKHEITVASFAELSNYVNYELLTRLPPDIPRIVKD
jgi:alanine racemase